MSKRFRKISATFLVTLMLFLSSAGFFAAPQSANAQMVVTDPVTGTNTTINNVEDFLDKVLLGGVVMALLNAANYFAKKFAYDAAVYIAAGGKGEGPLFHQKDFGSYLEDVALGAAGEAIGTISEIGFAGFDLCNPTGQGAPRIELAVQMGIASQYSAPEPKCDWNQIEQGWTEFVESFETGEILNNISLSIGPGQTGVHATFEAPLQAGEMITKELRNAEKTRNEGEGFKALTDIVSGRQKTPSAVVRETALEESARSKGKEETRTASILGPVVSKGVVQVLTVALGTFVNTLATQLLKSAFSEGTYSVTGSEIANCGYEALLTGKCTTADLTDPNVAGRGGRAAARVAYGDILKPRVQEVNGYDVIAEFTVCPSSLRGPNNCAMDSSFASVVRQALQGDAVTIQEAVNQNLLHGDWPLVSANEEDRARNADPFCFSNAYCYSNLVKLRKARIIPIGFELAAEKASGGSPTLQEVLNGFDSCPGPGELVTERRFRFCKLLDPNWILKYPLTQCRSKVYGPTVISAEADMRAEICVDAPTCIEEDENGICTSGYGYCTKEKNIWRFKGDECPAEYASCQNYRSEDNVQLAGIKETFDLGICNFENTGCRWYASDQEPVGGEGDWLSTTGRVYLDSDAGKCEQKSLGCSELIEKENLSINLVRNPSFEDDDNGDDHPDRWVGTVLAYERDIADAPDGRSAVRIDSGGLYQKIFIDPGQSYTISVSSINTGGGFASAQIEMTIRDVNGGRVLIPTDDTTCTVSGIGTGYLTIREPGDSWGREECYIIVPPAGADPSTHASYIDIFARTGGDGLIDAVQLEEGITATDFHSNAYQGAQTTYLKQPPNWLACTGNETDSAQCNSYARVCRVDEVGCDSYRPATGGSSIPGIVSSENRCPAECAGYAAYKGEESSFGFAQYPVHIIPDRAQGCSAAAAGCSEFTNLDTLEAGGEAREYWSTLRICERPAPGERAPAYYTWEGSDTTGFQLKEWRLKSGRPLLRRTPVEEGLPPAYIPGTDEDACTRDIHLAGTNPDCREFFDTAGNISYRLYTRTIVVTEENCVPLRITEQPVDNSIGDAAGCSAEGGRWNGSSNQCLFCEQFGGTWNSGDPSDPGYLGCTFYGYTPESRSCGSSEASCRLYTGNAGSNVRIMYSEDFESGEREDWGPEISVGISTEAVTVGGHSLRVAAGTTLSHTASSSSLRIIEGNTYFLSFWAKGRGNLSAQFGNASPGSDFADGDVTLGTTWNLYEFGPVLVDWSVDSSETLEFSGFADVSFIDRIELKEVSSNIALIKDSWTIPLVCDENQEGEYLPQAQLGCTEYDSLRGGRTEYLTGFSSLCREQSVGCRAYIDTQESESSGRESWNAMCVLASAVTGAVPEPCLVDGVQVCLVGVASRSCRYVSDDVPPEVSCTRSTEGICKIDGVTIIDSSGTPCRVGAGGSCDGQPMDLVVIPADDTVYLVSSPKVECEAEFAGCMLGGRADAQVCDNPDGPDDGDDPDSCTTEAGCECFVGVGTARTKVCTINNGETSCRAPLPFREPYPSGTSVFYSDEAVLNQPRSYEGAICTQQAVGCETWTETDGDGSKAYFKNPDNRICEYREGVEVMVVGTPVTTDGWFREGTDEPCYEDYLISGVNWGVWRNGDPNYKGFVGSCPKQYSTCTEFDDAADVDMFSPRGKQYYFLRNDELDESSCKGQVSQRQGCVLFNDTSNTVLNANAEISNARSYLENNGLVTAASCPDGGCGQCMYSKSVPPGCTDRRWGGACIDANDCAIGLRGAEEATCVYPDNIPPGPDSAIPRFGFGGGGGLDTCSDLYYAEDGEVSTAPSAFRSWYRGRLSDGSYIGLPNDGNLTLKVGPDRVCGEWLACQSSTPVWDPTKNRFRELCDVVGLCNEFAAAGESTQCISWLNSPTEILTESIYKKRDTSYYGLDFSGYSIPHQFSAGALQQIPVGRFCTEDSGRSCKTNSDCTGAGVCDRTINYRLVRVIGDCPAEAPPGEECTNPGRPEFGTGSCYSTFCAQSPLGNQDPSALAHDMPQALVPAPSSLAQNAESPSCRVYPERDAPFPNSVVTRWGSPLASDIRVIGEEPRGIPLAVKQGFGRVKLCEQGEACECSYQKVIYENAQETLYTSLTGGNYPTGGVCSGGSLDKQPCDTNMDCRNVLDDGSVDTSESAVCQKIEKINEVQGLEGYCLERDLATPINGQEANILDLPGRACITWLPVDRLSGAPDVYNSYPDAGFNQADAFYCAVPELYRVLAPYGGNYHVQPQHLTYTNPDSEGDDLEFDVSFGCSEGETGYKESPIVDNDFTGNTESGRSYGHTNTVRVQTDDDQDIIDGTCNKNTGFFIITEVEGGHCEQGIAEDNDYTVICIPRNSVHMADSQKRPCTPQELSWHPNFMQGWRQHECTAAERAARSPGDVLCRGSDDPENDGENYNTSELDDLYGLGENGEYGAEWWVLNEVKWVVYDREHGGGRDYTANYERITTGADGGMWELDEDESRIHGKSILAYYGDCQVQDHTVAGSNSQVPPSLPFFGCEAPVQVSGVDKTNKVFTGRLGSGRPESTPPPDRYQIADITGISTPELQYEWGTAPAPYGQISTNNVDRFTELEVRRSPIDIPSCINGRAVSLADPAPGGPACLGVGELSPGLRNESRPYTKITGGASGTACNPLRNTPSMPDGSGGMIPGSYAADLTCSGNPSCSTTGGNCYRACSSDLDCDGADTCSTVEGAAGRRHCSALSTNSSGVEITTRVGCERDEGADAVFVGICRGGDLAGQFCASDDNCITSRCYAVSDAVATEGVCQGTGVSTHASNIDKCGWNDSCRGYEPDEEPGDRGIPILANTLDRLQQLFAMVTNIFVYRPQDNRQSTDELRRADYLPVNVPSDSLPDGHIAGSGGPGSAEDITGYNPTVLSYDISDEIGSPPAIASVGDCDVQGKCLEKTEGRITINQRENGQIIGGNGFKRVTMRFFGYASNDQMPIRNVTVDWGDGTARQDNPGSSYKNRRGYRLELSGTESRRVSRCDNTTFSTSPSACDDTSPFTYTHFYTCGPVAGHRCADGTDDCLREVEPGKFACVFRPFVQIKDNWGYCSGTCSGGPAGTSCYDATTNPKLVAAAAAVGEVVVDECDIGRSARFGGNPYIIYPDDIVVYPKE